MAAYDLNEQEKLGDLKAWWARFGNIVTGILLLILLAIAGHQGWNWWQARQAASASGLYFTVSQAVEKDETDKLRAATAELLNQYGGTGYAPRAALLAAKAEFEAGQLDAAKQNLEWVIAKSKEDELKNLARLRLAHVLIDQKQYDAALSTLDGKHHASFDALYLDLKGDIFVHQGKIADARTAYQAALAKFDRTSGQRGYTQTKLDALPAGAAQ